MANGGFGQGFGQAWGQSMEIDRKREEEERRRDRRTLLLTQIIGAPIAQGITEGVTEAIKAPFKDPIQNYFNTSQGLDLQKEVRQTKLIKDTNTANYGKLVSSASGRGVKEFGEPEIQRRLDALDQSLKTLNAGYEGEVKDLPGYADKVIKIREDVLGKGGWLDKNNESIKNLYKSLIDIPDLSDKRVKAAVARFNSESSGLIGQGARKLKRVFTGKTLEQERKEALQSMLSELGLTEGNLTGVDKAYLKRIEAASTREEVVNSISNYFKDIEKNPEVAARVEKYRSQQTLITELLTNPSRKSDLNTYNEILQLQKEGTLEKVFITPEYLEDYKSGKIENLIGLPLDQTQYSQWRAYTLGQDTKFLKTLRDHEAFIRRLDTGKTTLGQKSATEQSEAFTENVYETARRIVNANVLANDELKAYILEDNRYTSKRFMDEVDRVATVIANNHVILTNADGQQVSFSKLDNLFSQIAEGIGVEGATEEFGTALKLRPYLTIDQQGISDSGLYLKADDKINIKKIRAGDVTFNPSVEVNGSGQKSDPTTIDTTKETVVVYANQTDDNTAVADFYRDRRQVLDDAIEMGQESGDFQAALNYYNAEINNINTSFAEVARAKNVKVVDNAATLNRIQYLKDAAKTIVPDKKKDVLFGGSDAPQLYTEAEMRQQIKDQAGIGDDTLPRTFTPPDFGFGNITNIFDPEIRKRARAGTYENYLAQKEQEDNSLMSSTIGVDNLPRTFTPPARASRKLEITLGPVIDKLTNTFIPAAEASTQPINLPAVKKQAERKGTSIEQIINLEKQKNIDKWEAKGSIEVEGVYTDNKKITVDTKDPVKFIKDNNFNIVDSVAIYSAAVEQHNASVPKGISDVYKLNPVESALTWHLEANPQDRTIVESTYRSLQRQRMSKNTFGSKLNTDSIQKELETYEEKISKMTKAEKETEFKKQLTIAQGVNVITEQDLINNSTEYRKLQLIFGENDNRKIPLTKYIDRKTGKMVTETTTVNDKVNQYYTSNSTDYDSIAKRLDIYRNVLNNIGVNPKSLLASN